jgi:hypothetical protein
MFKKRLDITNHIKHARASSSSKLPSPLLNALKRQLKRFVRKPEQINNDNRYGKVRNEEVKE